MRVPFFVRILFLWNGSIRYLTLLLILLPLAKVVALHAQSSSYQAAVLGIQQQIENNDLDGARASLASAMKLYPNDGGLENLLGVVEIQSGHREAARQAFTRAIAHSPQLAGACLNLARIDMETADHDARAAEEAFHLYGRVLALDAANPEAVYGEATAAMWRHQYAVSLEGLQKLSAETRAKARVQAVLCVDELGLGHKDAAEQAAAAMAASLDLSESDVMLAQPALRAARRADLLDMVFSAANARQPLSASGLRMLGLAQEAEGKQQQARETLERVYAIDPSATAPLVDLARLALAADDKQGALGYLAHARTLAPKDANLAYEYGFVSIKMDLLREARIAIGDAVRLAPGNPDYLLTMGTISSGAYALPYLRQYRELRPEDPVGYLAMGVAYFSNNDYANTILWLTKAAEDKKTAALAHYYLGRTLNQQARYNDAIVHLRQSAAIRPDQSEVFAELGEAYLSLGQYTEAAAQLRHALDLDPDDYVANYALLRLYSKTGDQRRDDQSKRFATVRGEKEGQYRDAMRVIEARPQPVSGDGP